MNKKVKQARRSVDINKITIISLLWLSSCNVFDRGPDDICHDNWLKKEKLLLIVKYLHEKRKHTINDIETTQVFSIIDYELSYNKIHDNRYSNSSSCDIHYKPAPFLRMKSNSSTCLLYKEKCPRENCPIAESLFKNKDA